MKEATERSLIGGFVLKPEDLRVRTDEARPACPDRAGTLWIVAGPAAPDQRITCSPPRERSGPRLRVPRGPVGKRRWRRRGAARLPWLRRVRDEIGLRTAVEVASVDQVEACLRHSVDILGVNLRMIGCASSLAEIADALHGVHVPILVGNPVEPDVARWAAALKRLGLAGGLIAVHQEFVEGGGSPNVRSPDWGVVAELKRLMPHLPVICDPSCIAGAAHGVAEVAHRAVELNTVDLASATNEGTEAARQEHEITAAQLHQLLAQLVPCGDSGRASGACAATVRDATALINELREQIDAVNASMIRALAQRILFGSDRSVGTRRQPRSRRSSSIAG